jgi:hypothetical protein
MNKIITGIISALLIAGIVSVYAPNASATLGGLGDCTGNSALGQQPRSEGEQGTGQDQAGASGAQSVSPEFNALTGNSFNLNQQQNGECSELLDNVPVSPFESTSPQTLGSTAASQVTDDNSTEQ